MAENVEKEALSPEEKLLKVIQDGDEQQEDPAAESPEVATDAAATKTDQPPEAETAEAPEPAGRTAKSAAAATPAAATESSAPAVIKAPGGKSTSTLIMISRGLAAAVAVMLALSALEIWGAVRTLNQDQALPVIMPDTEEAAAVHYTPSLQPLPGLLNAITGKPFLRRPGQIETQVVRVDPQTPQPPPPPPPPADWQKYAQNNLSLKGFSQLLDGSDATEVIISDDKEQRMFFLRQGQTILLETVEVELTAVRNDNVTLSDGKTTYMLR